MMTTSGIDLTGIYASTLEGRRRQGVKKDMDKEAFLMLLVTELRHQNPLEPMDNKDLISQLSQLASLESISNMANSVKDFVNFNSSIVKAQAASMVGKQVVVRTDTLRIVDGIPENIVFNLDEPAHLVIKIMDDSGRVLYTEDLGDVDAGLHVWKWNGRDSNGMPLKDGVYKYSISKISPDGKEEDIGGLTHGKVEAVQFEGDDIYLLVEGERYPVSALVEISEEVSQA